MRWWLTAFLASLALVAGCTAPAVCRTVSFTPQVLLPRSDFADTAGLRVADVDGNGGLDILATSPLHGQVTVLRGCPAACRSINFTEGLTAPVRTQVVDLDGNGLQDILVADIGVLFPSDELAGKVVWLKAVAPWRFEPVTLLEHVGRVSCAEAADLDGDKDLDIVVCIFGHDSVGSLAWLERRGDAYAVHHLDPRPGTIHAFPVDLDGDGDLDIATSIAQMAEEVDVWTNDGHGGFTKRVLASGLYTYYGMSGIQPADLDQDGDTDLIALHGDVYDMDTPADVDPLTFYGAFWLENDGKGEFERHELTQGWGLYSAQAVDLDGDGDLDIAMGALQMERSFPGRHGASLLWLQNDGNEGFTRHDVMGMPPQIVPMEAADLDHDGHPELLVGSHFPDQSEGGDQVVRIVPQALPCPAATTG